MKYLFLIFLIFIASCAHAPVNTIQCYDRNGEPAGTVEVVCETSYCPSGFMIVTHGLPR